MMKLISMVTMTLISIITMTTVVSFEQNKVLNKDTKVPSSSELKNFSCKLH